MIYVGIDNGLSGALCALSDHPGPPIDMIAMPTTGTGKGNEVDAKQILDWLDRFDVGRMTVILETPGKYSPGIMSVASMWDSYGACRGILAAYSIRHHRIDPLRWQKVMLPGCRKGDTKPHALRVARQLWPDEKWLLTPRCKTPDTGLIDAALIAEYARRMKL